LPSFAEVKTKKGECCFPIKSQDLLILKMPVSRSNALRHFPPSFKIAHRLGNSGEKNL